MIGETISHYKILEKLGEGGMGVVYRAEDLKLGRPVALKFLPPELTRNEDAKKRFIQEARTASALDHPNICTIYEIDEIDVEQMFIAMALYDGETLEARISRGPLNLLEALDITMQIADGLSRAHESGVIHRDVKPANVIITERVKVKIVDFGLSKLAGKTRLTREGTTLGTVGFMSPEQVRGEEIDHRTDIWSLGVILYEVLTGRPPFKGEYDQAVMFSILNDEPEPVTALRVGLPIEIDRILGKAMANKPDERYQHIDDLVVDLRSLGKQIESGAGISAVRRKAAGRGYRPLLFTGIAFIVIVTALILLWIVYERGEPIDSIAVLPLENLSGDPGEDYFADGMTEALIADLAKISALKVISRTSVMQYKEMKKPLPEIADELGVDAIVEGSILRAGDRIRINAQLIEASTDRHLWVQSYEHDARDVLALQSEVARAIAGEIEIKLTKREKERLENVGPVKPEAHEAYLKGRYQWNKRTGEALTKSIGYFEQAIEIDPDYALAHAGLADVWWVQGDLGLTTPREAYRKSRTYALRALELDGDLAEAHTALALVAVNLDWNFEEGEEGFKLALSLNPNYATAHQLYAEFLTHMGRLDEALIEITKAQELDPFSIIISTVNISVLRYARQYDEGILAAKETLELDKNFPIALNNLAIIYYNKGMHDLSVYTSARAMAELGISRELVDSYEDAYKLDGIKGIARWNIKHADKILALPFSESFFKAVSYAHLGEVDSMVYYLEETLERRSLYSLFIGVEESFNPYRADPRFEALIQRVGLPVNGIEGD